MTNLLKNILNNAIVISIFLMFFLNIFSIHVSAVDDKPDISILPNIIYDEELTEGEKSTFVLRIKNVGEKNISNENLEIFLFRDQIEDWVAFNSTQKDLDIDESIYLNISWTPDFGDNSNHVLKIYVNYNQIFDERSFDNNVAFFPNIKINRKDTEISIDSFNPADRYLFNITSVISADILNTGKDASENITAELSSNIEGKIQSIEISGIKENEKYSFNFNWTPKNLGVHNLTLDIFYATDLHDSISSDVTVSLGDYEWWDENWHYRYLISIDGYGNFSKFFNFTEILKNYGLFGKTFENGTIRIVKYSNSGEINYVVENYSFIESNVFNKTNNATGYLNWNIPVESEDNIYVIYFDVSENIGFRSMLSEKEIGEISLDFDIIFDDIFESWWAEIVKPKKSSLLLVDEPVNISVLSTAKIKKVYGSITHKENQENNFSFNLSNFVDNLEFFNESVVFNKEGDWTVNINCVDDAGFFYNFSTDYYIGQPDLIASEIEINLVKGNSFSIFHVNDTLNVTAYIKSLFVSIDDVNVTFSILDDQTDNFIYNSTIKSNLSEDQTTILNFIWKANMTGDFVFSIFVDSSEEITELDEENNIISKDVSIYEWPNIIVDNIFLPSDKIFERDQVNIDVDVENKGPGDAEDYKITLFIDKKQSDDSVMLFRNEVDTKYFDIKSDSTKMISLIWDIAKVGNYFVGVKIEYSNNNGSFIPYFFVSEKILKVYSIESENPVIQDVIIDPISPIQGEEITISAMVYDSSLLNEVSIEITTPDGNTFSDGMFRTQGNYFAYVFDSTDIVGRYSYRITAVDNSAKKNQRVFSGNFSVGFDDLDPVINNIYANPFVQLKDKEISIYCICTDNIGISEVELTVFSPDGAFSVEDMMLSENNKYIYTNIYKEIGKYIYTIDVQDEDGNRITSSEKIFWITKDINDTDSDGIIDPWEDEYGFDKFDSSDAKIDSDSDGYTNLEEYKMNTNPREDILFENIAFNIRDNIWYLIASSLVFLIILIVFYVAKKRRIIG